MKICWDNLEKLKYSQNTKKWYYTGTTYIYVDACATCKEPFLLSKYHKGKVIKKMPEMRRANGGVGMEFNNIPIVIEIYSFDPNNSPRNFINAKKTGYMLFFPGTALEMNAKVKTHKNGKSILMGYENHPLKDKIIEAYMNI